MNRARVGLALSLGVAVSIGIAFGLGAFRPSERPLVLSAPDVHAICDEPDPERPCVFAPAEIAIAPGTTVRWTNHGDVFHTVTSTVSLAILEPSGLFDHSLSRSGESFEFHFENLGTFHYYCRVHAEFMTGTIVVQ